MYHPDPESDLSWHQARVPDNKLTFTLENYIPVLKSVNTGLGYYMIILSSFIVIYVED